MPVCGADCTRYSPAHHDVYDAHDANKHHSVTYLQGGGSEIRNSLCRVGKSRFSGPNQICLCVQLALSASHGCRSVSLW